ncbi:MAG: pyridoxal 5'-phosphate synthase glutaminase subunit PdxT [Sandaracinaceae bacterium]|nr:pyridoxal 5'-phosphate synthase glutaminase subunit PdxT [Sandaracinaceae bacterium]
MRVGVLALQGAFREHVAVLAALGHETVEVRGAEDVDGLDGIVLPGGESTAQARLLTPELAAALDALVASGAPVLATCAGAILASRRGWLDADLERNAYGRQLHSAEAVADDGTPLVLIRAPRFTRLGSSVEVLARLGDDPVLIRQGALVAATFHPELTDDARVHAGTFG